MKLTKSDLQHIIDGLNERIQSYWNTDLFHYKYQTHRKQREECLLLRDKFSKQLNNKIIKEKYND